MGWTNKSMGAFGRGNAGSVPVIDTGRIARSGGGGGGGGSLISWNAVDARQFQAMLDETIRFSRRTAPEEILWAAINFCQSARKRTPISVMKRAVTWNQDDRTAWAHPYLIERWTQRSRTPVYLLADSPNDPRVTIATRGSARNSWNGAMRALNKGNGTGPGTRAGTGRKIAWTSDTPAIEIVNRIRYMLNIAPQIVQEALDAATRALGHRLDKAALKLAGRWR